MAEPVTEAEPSRFRTFWNRHRSLFWIFHSVWAMATGIAVIILARERYGFVPWVVVFLGLTWASTLFFGGKTGEKAAVEAAEDEAESGESPSPGLLDEVTSYATRTMYQETLFFLLPFYAYSTVFRSPNVVFLGLLGALAFLSCLDLLFDRWLRLSPVFGLVFFASVAFAGLNLVLPMALALPPRIGTPVAAAVALAGAGLLAWRTTEGSTTSRLRLTMVGVVLLGIAVGLPRLIPPVPLRLDAGVFSTAIDHETLAVADTLDDGVAAGRVSAGIVVLAQVFAPSALPAHVTVEWLRDGEPVRISRQIEVTANASGFRVWDALRPAVAEIVPGTYRVVLRSQGARVFGVRELVVGGG